MRNPADRLGCLHYRSQQSQQYNYTTIAARIATNVSWLKLWDMALDYGPHGTVCLQALIVNSQYHNSQRVFVISVVPYSISPVFIIIFSHTRLSNPERLISSLSSADLDILCVEILSNSYFISSAVPLLAYIA